MSLFDLPQAPAALGDVSKWSYQRIESSSGFNSSNPSGTSHLFRIQASGTRWWVPSRSYFKVNATLTALNNNRKPADPIAGSLQVITDAFKDERKFVFTAGFCGNFINTIEARVGGTVVSQINTMLPQIDAIHTRTSHSGDWLDQFGVTTNNTYAYYPKDYPQNNLEIYDIFSDKRQFCWHPPLGIFQVPHAIPGMQVDLSVVINPNFKVDCVQFVDNQGYVDQKQAGSTTVDERLYNHTPQGTGFQYSAADYSLTIDDFSFHACMVESNRGDNERFVLNINDWNAQALPLAAILDTQLSQFDVNPATNILGVALQDIRQSTQLTCRSRFNVHDYSGKYVLAGATALTKIQLEYDGQFFPDRYMDPSFAVGYSYRDTQAMYETALATGQIYSSSGPEQRYKHLNRGRFFLFQVPRDGKSTATRVLVHTTLGAPVKADNYDNTSAPAPLPNANLILFSRAPKAFLIRVSDSRVVQVEGTLNANR